MRNNLTKILLQICFTHDCECEWTDVPQNNIIIIIIISQKAASFHVIRAQGGSDKSVGVLEINK